MIKHIAVIGIIVFVATGFNAGAQTPSPAEPPKSEGGQSEAPKAAPQERDPNRLWCNEHGLYEDECTICHPELVKKTEKRDPNRLWCKEHSVYEDECTICHPELMKKTEERDPNRLWCNEHGLYEDECTICHPELVKKTEARDPSRLWCNEHGLYEDECTICHPELMKVSSLEDTSDVLQCTEHGVAEQECGICHPELIATMVPGQGLKVRFESTLSAEKAGVVTGSPEQRTIANGSDVFARVSYDRNTLAVITPLAGGVVTEVRVDVGDVVERGQILATVNSLELASAKSAYVTALAEERLAAQVFERQRDLHAEDVSTQQQLDEARTDFEMHRSESARARQHLLNLGLNEDEVAEVGNAGAASSVLPIRAPFAGTVVDRSAVLGSAIETGDPMFEIADLSQMWVELSVPESHLGALETGKTVAAEFDAYPGVAFNGTVTWIAPSIDEHSRMVQARAVMPNPDAALKHGMFGRVRLGAEATTRLAVPEDAIQVIDGRTVVFAKLEPDLYETRIVTVGGSLNGWTAIEDGLDPLAEIAVAETYILRSELLKARLGAGCTDH